MQTWDEAVQASTNGTFLNSRLFLQYHREKFLDSSLVIYEHSSRGDEILAVFPAAQIDTNTVVSHPGATYGGLVTTRALPVEMTLEIIEGIKCHYAESSKEKLIYTPTPTYFHLKPWEADIYCLWKLGGRLERKLPNFVLELDNPLGRRKNRKLANKAGVVTSFTSEIDVAYDIIESALSTRHSVSPVHSRQELKELLHLFPRNIQVLLAKVNDISVAAAVVFFFPNAVHMQYLGSTDRGFQVQALDNIVEFMVSIAKEKFGLLSFGISSDTTGFELNTGLAGFKEGFGATVRSIDRYELNF